jgi:hypothetical protein
MATYTHLRRREWSWPALRFSRAGGVHEYAQGKPPFLPNSTCPLQLTTSQPFYASILVYNLSLTFVKLSILCQFLRFFTESRPRKICICMICLITAYGAAVQFVSIFACTPVPYFWDRSIANGYCIDLLAFWFSNASFNILTDLMICVLPVPVLKGLNLPRKQKYGLIAVFIVGGL